MLQPGAWKTSFQLASARCRERGGKDLTSWLFSTSEDLFQRSFVPRCYFLCGKTENLCISELRPRASRSQDLFRRLNHAGQHVLQKGIGQSKLSMAQSEECLYLLRHICEGGRDAGLKLGCRFRVIALAKFVLTSGNEECLLGTEAALFDRGPNPLPQFGRRIPKIARNHRLSHG